MYQQTPLHDVPRHYAGIQHSNMMLEYLSTVLDLTPRGGRALETGIGTGYGAIYLSLRGVISEGIDLSDGIVERAKQVNNILGGNAHFRTGDIFDLYETAGQKRWDTILHQGLIEHMSTINEIRSALAQQVALADHVIFSVPGDRYPHAVEFGNERLLPLDVWREILEPFEVVELRNYGDPQNGSNEHVLCVLAGQPVSADLIEMMQGRARPFPVGISAVVLAMNEAHNMPECIECLRWCDEIIVVVMDSDDPNDKTAEVCSNCGARVIHHPSIQPYDRARNPGIMVAKYSHILICDADERIPPALAEVLRQIVTTNGDNFEAMLLPFKHLFGGRWLRGLGAGYTSPRLYKNGHVIFNSRLHSGTQVDGRTITLPPDNPETYIEHRSFLSLFAYQNKQNNYTTQEALTMFRDGARFDWRRMLMHAWEDLAGYYDSGRAHYRDGDREGPLWLIYSLISSNYRLLQHAKLYEARLNAGLLQPDEIAIPRDSTEIAGLLFSAVSRQPKPLPPAIDIANSEAGVDVVISAPLCDASGYGEDSRNIALAADAAGVNLLARSLPWSQDPSPATDAEQKRLNELANRSARPGFIHIIQDFPAGWQRHPQAGWTIARTMYETDRFPESWIEAAANIDEFWVPTEFNKRSLADSGIDPARVTVIPNCFDFEPYLAAVEPTELTQRIAAVGAYTFLSVFDWTLHKGWDVLLRAFYSVAAEIVGIQLVLKVWSSNGYTREQILEQAAAFVMEAFGVDLLSDRRVVFVFDRLSRTDLIALYQACDCLVLPSRGEGWGRIFSEAAFVGKVVIGTNWSAQASYLSEDNSYPIDFHVVPVPPAGWREIGPYKGHRWAEPDVDHLVALMRRVISTPEEASAKAAVAQAQAIERYNREVVGRLIAKRLTELHVAGPVQVTESKQRSEPASSKAAPVRIVWEGGFFNWHSLANINREVSRRLANDPEVELSIVPVETPQFGPETDTRLSRLAERIFAPLCGLPSVHVRHAYPPRFARPDCAVYAHMVAWEYGFLPNLWADSIRQSVNLVLVYSSYLRDVCIASGIPKERIRITPPGADTAIFRPDVPPFVPTDEPGAARWREMVAEAGPQPADDERVFVFLFVGGAFHRKGIDILTSVFCKTFTAFDRVVMVVKDTGTQTVYRGGTERERLINLAADESRPLVIYLERDFPIAQLAGIYTMADCIVLPYRAEGFCLPALESMSAGRPVITTAGGPTDDYINESVGWRIKSTRKPFGDGRIGEWDCCGPTWMFEPDERDLSRLMREAYYNRAQTRAKGEAAAERVRESWSWEHSVARMKEAFVAMAEECKSPGNTDLPAQTPESAPPIAATVPAEDTDKKPELHDRRASKGKKAGSQKKSDLRLVTTMKSIGAASPAWRPIARRRRPRLTLCMIVRDEERTLDACLTSVLPYVDECVLVDTGSVDRTVEIATRHGCRVFHFDWCDDFSAARNFGLEQATGDWIIWLDADDTISPECGAKLRELIAMAEDRTTGFIMQVHIPPGPGEDGYTQVDHVKLFRKNYPDQNSPIKFLGRLHEQLLEPIYAAGGTVLRTDLYVTHSGYDRSAEGQAKKRNRDTTILALDEAERPDHPFPRFNYGMTYYHWKDYNMAIQKFQECLDRSGPRESTLRKVYAMLSGCYLGIGDLENARRAIDTGLSLTPADPELLFRAGNLRRSLSDPAAAEMFYMRLLNSRESGHIDSLDVTMTTYKLKHNLALTLQDMNRLTEAEAYWRSALADNPTFAPSWHGLGDLFVRQRRFDDARAVVEKLAGMSQIHADALIKSLTAAQNTQAF